MGINGILEAFLYSTMEKELMVEFRKLLLIQSRSNL